MGLLKTALGSIDKTGVSSSILKRLGSTPSQTFIGESKRDRSKRKKFDNKRRRKNEPTSSELFAQNIDYRTNKPLTGAWKAQYEKIYGSSNRSAGGGSSSAQRKRKVENENNAISDMPAWVQSPLYLGLAGITLIGGTLALTGQFKTKTKRRRR